MVWYDMFWYGMVWYGMAWYGMVCMYDYVCTYIYIINYNYIWMDRWMDGRMVKKDQNGRAKIIPACQKMDPSKQVVLLWGRSERMLETMEQTLFDSDELAPLMHHDDFGWVLSLKPDQHQEFGPSRQTHEHLGARIVKPCNIGGT